MNIYLGNLQFEDVRNKLGFQLTEEDRVTWEKFHNNKADLSGMESSFHVFDIPKAIVFKGEAAKEAILQMFTPEKLIEPMGTVQVSEQK